jgi:uncharacterized membrane protein YbhN (UPF0104 family)
MTLWLRVGVSVGLLALLIFLVPWTEAIGAVRRLPPSLWVLVWLGFIGGHSLSVIKWRLFVNAGHARLGFRDAVHCYSAGLFANLCLPSIVGGDVLRAVLATRFTRRPEAAFLGGVLDRLTDMLGLSLLVGIGGLLAGGALPGWWGNALQVGLVVGMGLVVLSLPLILRRPLKKWPRKFRRQIGRGLVAVRRLARNPGTAALALGLSLAIQSSFVLLNRGLGEAIGIQVPLAVWFLVWPLAKVASLMPISLGGLAVREATLAALLAPFGVPFAVGIVCSLLWQSVLIAGGLVGGLTWLVLDRTRPVQPVLDRNTTAVTHHA